MSLAVRDLNLVEIQYESELQSGKSKKQKGKEHLYPNEGNYLQAANPYFHTLCF